MREETIRIIEELRKISDSEWEKVKKELKIEGKSITHADIVHKTIKSIGVPVNLKGYQYIQEAVLLCIEDPEKLNGITTVLYPALARKFNTIPSRIEKGIRYAIEVTLLNGDKKKIEEVFGKSPLANGKLENSRFIAGVVDYVLN